MEEPDAGDPPNPPLYIEYSEDDSGVLTVTCKPCHPLCASCTYYGTYCECSPLAEENDYGECVCPKNHKVTDDHNNPCEYDDAIGTIENCHESCWEC
ncbi:MAG: hypothetical protein V2I33_20620, partial [Kangiellaceae bacterium]|nr:hypothetical protein [Kangiellaceae bacterium]